MKPELREKIIQYNRHRAEVDEQAGDFLMLLHALPPGQVKNLLKDPVCGMILEKYGVE